jgi:hypothetical protein
MILSRILRGTDREREDHTHRSQNAMAMIADALQRRRPGYNGTHHRYVPE